MKMKKLDQKIADKFAPQAVIKEEITQEVEQLHTRLNTLNNLISQMKTRLTPILDTSPRELEDKKTRPQRLTHLGEDLGIANDMVDQAVEQIEELFDVIKL